METSRVNIDKHTVTAFLEKRFERLSRYVRRKIPLALQKKVEVNEVIQEVHLRIFQSVGTFEMRDDTSFDRWMMTIAHNVIQDYVKRESRRDKRLKRRETNKSSPDLSEDLFPPKTSTPSRSTVRRERVQTVRTALASIEPQYREALHMRYERHMPVAEIAKLLGKTQAAVHSLCNRGLKQLRRSLDNASSYRSTDR